MTVVGIHILTMVCTFTANIMVVGSLIGAKQLDSKINRMFFALSVCDGIVAVVVQPMTILMLVIKRDQRFCDMELAVQTLSTFSTHCSAYFVVAIGVERFLSIKASQLPRNASQISYKRPYLLLFTCIFAAASVSASYSIATRADLFNLAHIVLVILDFFTLLSVYSVYIEMYRSVARHVKETAFLRRNNDSNAAYAVEMAKAISLIIFFLFVSYIPYLTSGTVIFHTTFMQGKTINDKHAFATYLTYNCVYLNSFFNPVIVLHKNKKLFAYVKKKIRTTTRSFAPNSVVQNVDSILKPVTIRDVRPRV